MRDSDDPQQHTQFKIRIPVSMYEKMKEIKNKEEYYRPMNQFMLEAIKKYIKDAS